MPKRKQRPDDILAMEQFEGNKGGDYLQIHQTREQNEESCLYIEVGHCCVVTLKAVVPVEFLTSLLTKFMHTSPDGMGRSSESKLADFAREAMGEWPEDFINERLSKIKGGWNFNAKKL